MHVCVYVLISQKNRYSFEFFGFIVMARIMGKWLAFSISVPARNYYSKWSSEKSHQTIHLIYVYQIILWRLLHLDGASSSIFFCLFCVLVLLSLWRKRSHRIQNLTFELCRWTRWTAHVLFAYDIFTEWTFQNELYKWTLCATAVLRDNL